MKDDNPKTWFVNGRTIHLAPGEDYETDDPAEKAELDASPDVVRASSKKNKKK